MNPYERFAALGAGAEVEKSFRRPSMPRLSMPSKRVRRAAVSVAAVGAAGLAARRAHQRSPFGVSSGPSGFAVHRRPPSTTRLGFRNVTGKGGFRVAAGRSGGYARVGARSVDVRRGATGGVQVTSQRLRANRFRDSRVSRRVRSRTFGG